MDDIKKVNTENESQQSSIDPDRLENTINDYNISLLKNYLNDYEMYSYAIWIWTAITAFLAFKDFTGENLMLSAELFGKSYGNFDIMPVLILFSLLNIDLFLQMKGKIRNNIERMFNDQIK